MTPVEPQPSPTRVVDLSGPPPWLYGRWAGARRISSAISSLSLGTAGWDPPANESSRPTNVRTTPASKPVWRDNAAPVVAQMAAQVRLVAIHLVSSATMSSARQVLIATLVVAGIGTDA